MSESKPRDAAEAAILPVGIGYLIGRLDHSLSRRMQEVLMPIGLTVSQYTALSFIESKSQISNSQLAQRALISPQSANEMVKQMEIKGWVMRTPDPFHGRVVQVNLTANGKQLLKQAHANAARVEAHMLEGFTQVQQNAIHVNLRKMLQLLNSSFP
jgi:DNA-binding MarR family transcriptional regulator